MRRLDVIPTNRAAPPGLPATLRLEPESLARGVLAHR
jgi:hypothetical protein